VVCIPLGVEWSDDLILRGSLSPLIYPVGQDYKDPNQH
jgi:hypothetical protein